MGLFEALISGVFRTSVNNGSVNVPVFMDAASALSLLLTGLTASKIDAQVDKMTTEMNRTGSLTVKPIRLHIKERQVGKLKIKGRTLVDTKPVNLSPAAAVGARVLLYGSTLLLTRHTIAWLLEVPTAYQAPPQGRDGRDNRPQQHGGKPWQQRDNQPQHRRDHNQQQQGSPVRAHGGAKDFTEYAAKNADYDGKI